MNKIDSLKIKLDSIKKDYTCHFEAFNCLILLG
jgi:hypothetical protein